MFEGRSIDEKIGDLFALKTKHRLRSVFLRTDLHWSRRKLFQGNGCDISTTLPNSGT